MQLNSEQIKQLQRQAFVDQLKANEPLIVPKGTKTEFKNIGCPFDEPGAFNPNPPAKCI